MSGILYGVGVGPGDPELITYKAVKIIENAAVIAVPGNGESERTALSIARSYVGKKPVLELKLPMTRDREVLQASHFEAAQTLIEYLEQEKDVAFLTLGDPSIYSTFIYIHRIVEKRGLKARFVPGVPSFCAAAACLNQPLCEGEQPLHIIPASYEGALEGMQWPGTKVLMKSGKKLKLVKKYLQESGQSKHGAMVERCGMEGERIFSDLDLADDQAGYFSLLVVKEGDSEA